MAGVDLGLKPLAIKVNLSRGGSFTTTARASTPWPAGVSVVLVFEGSLTDTPIEWTATLNGTDAVWDIDPPEVTEVIIGGFTTVRLHYVEADGSVFVYGSGKLNVL